jgi:hypothetical protein
VTFREKNFAWMLDVERKDSAKSEAQGDREAAATDAEFKWKPGTAQKKSSGIAPNRKGSGNRRSGLAARSHGWLEEFEFSVL